MKILSVYKEKLNKIINIKEKRSANVAGLFFFCKVEASVTQQLWNNKAYISVGIVDPFRWNTFRSENIYKNIDERTKEINNVRTVKVSFQYKFGSDKIKKNRSRSTGTEDTQNRSY